MANIFKSSTGNPFHNVEFLSLNLNLMRNDVTDLVNAVLVPDCSKMIEGGLPDELWDRRSEVVHAYVSVRTLDLTSSFVFCGALQVSIKD